MAEKDDGLGLSLSFRCPEEQYHPPPQQPPAATATAAPFPLNLFGHSDAFPSSAADRNAEQPRSLFRGIDINQSITVIDDCDEEVIVSSPNSTVSSVSGKRSREREENDGERGSSSLEIDDDDGGDAAGRKKLRLSKEQATVLEQMFKSHNTLNPKQKLALAKQLNLRPRQVEVWFQNRRARTKLKQTEVDCEYMRRCCENLTEENRRLQREVNELRALKLSPQFYMNMSPPTTLTMCPQCERVAVSSSVGRAHHQQPMPMASWAAIIPPQPLARSIDAHQPKLM
ncbi:hypothetical protein ACJIZ3_007811 [Penstemon smallii]|uniref:Homeobox domain-containing protein n=1 Tax=Penstemon smallii TaxID=265156 RepID=A0ABD3T803_9LAMI